MVKPPIQPTSTSLNKSNNPIKFLSSYGGKIVPRYPDGKLRYIGGHTRVLAVNRSISFAELLVKMGELGGTQVSLRCQLPTEDLDSLVSIKSDEDLGNLIEEYNRVGSSPLKIRAFLLPIRSSKTFRPSSESPKSVSEKSQSPSSSFSAGESSSPRSYVRMPAPVPVVEFPICYGKTAGRKRAQNNHDYRCRHCHGFRAIFDSFTHGLAGRHNKQNP